MSGAAGFSARIGHHAAEISAAQQDLIAFLAAAGASPRAANRAAVLLEEVALNALRHGGAQEVSVEAQVEGAGCVLRFADRGRAFDPTAAALPDAPAGLAAAPDGGRGLVLLRKFAEALAYERQGAENRLTVRLAA